MLPDRFVLDAVQLCAASHLDVLSFIKAVAGGRAAKLGGSAHRSAVRVLHSFARLCVELVPD